MARLKAATVSDQVIPRKRKRKPARPPGDDGGQDVATAEPAADAGATISMPTKADDGGRKPRRRVKADGAPPAPLRRDSSTMVESSIPWPEVLRRLAQTYRALNLVYTFCCTRKHFATTFDNIRGAVQGHTKRELGVDEVAQIKALVPRSVNFAYVDEAMLQVAVMGEHGPKGGSRPGDLPHMDFRHEENDDRADNGAGKEVLFFEFIDGDLKRQVVDPQTGQPANPRQRLRNEDLKMPVFSQKQMLRLIEKRNAKFTSAVNEFLNQCAADDIDAVVTIVRRGQVFMPMPSTSRGTTPGPETSSKPPATIPKERKSIPEIILQLKDQEWYTQQVVPDGHRVFDPQPPVYGELKFELSQNLVNALYNTKNITQFYSHQAEAINHLHDGNHVIVSTSTSSGKSLIYQVPMLHALEEDPNSRGMYIFPTKALAQDQRRSLKELLSFMPGLEDVIAETFDGDTPMNERNQIREEARIIFTNPDMLHITILPQEGRWRTFLQNLKLVVVDELHVYNGLFGSHVAFIMRRLQRICAAVGNRHVRFISCSATVANPEAHMRTVFGIDDVQLVDFDGSPSGRKEFLCWNTPFRDPRDPTSGRGDAMAEAARLVGELILRGVRVIAFCRIRKQCEVLLTAVRQYAQRIERPEVAARVMGYRGGYSAPDRRRIEAEMFSGKLMGIVATTALELGVDIGSLDAVVTCGFPYTIANLRQQSGRAGRRNRDSLSVLVGDSFATDQHYMSNPDEIFTKPNCELQVDLMNELVMEGHLQCASYEMPLRADEDQVYFGKQLPEMAAERLVKDESGFYHCNERFRPQPSKCVAIRDTEDGHFAVVDVTDGRNIVLEEVEPSRAFFTIYEGGIFLHQGQTYLVKEFAPERQLARVRRVTVDWTTQQRDFTDIDPVETEAIRRLPAPSLSRAFFGPIRVTAHVFGFFKLDKHRRVLDAVHIDNPPVVIRSRGLWLDVPRAALELLRARRLNLAAGIHAAEHAVLSLMPQFVVSMPGDVRTEFMVAIMVFANTPTPRTRPARLTFYDATGGAGGSGVAAKAFEFVDLLLGRAVERVAACHCVEGCVECVCSELCKQANVVTSKAGAEVILKCLLGREDEIDVDALPWGEEEKAPAGIETIVDASFVPPGPKGRPQEVLVDRGRENHNDVIVIKEEPLEEEPR